MNTLKDSMELMIDQSGYASLIEAVVEIVEEELDLANEDCGRTDRSECIMALEKLHSALGRCEHICIDNDI